MSITIELDLLKTFGEIVTPAGLAIGAFLFLGRDIVAKNIFPALNKQHAYHIIIVLGFMAWTIALAGIVSWTYVLTHKSENSEEKLVRKNDVDNVIDIHLGNPGYGGTGCPRDTASVVISEDKRTISLIYDQYFIKINSRYNKKSFDRKSCNLAVPISIPAGFRVSVMSIDYRGTNSLSQGADSSMFVEHFFAGTRGPVFERKFQGFLDEQFFFHQSLDENNLIWSQCGQGLILRANTSIIVHTNKERSSGFTSVDTQDIDVKAAIQYKIQWEKCDKSTY